MSIRIDCVLVFISNIGENIQCWNSHSLGVWTIWWKFHWFQIVPWAGIANWNTVKCWHLCWNSFSRNMCGFRICILIFWKYTICYSYAFWDDLRHFLWWHISPSTPQAFYHNTKKQVCINTTFLDKTNIIKIWQGCTKFVIKRETSPYNIDHIVSDRQILAILSYTGKYWPYYDNFAVLSILLHHIAA